MSGPCCPLRMLGNDLDAPNLIVSGATEDNTGGALDLPLGGGAAHELEPELEPELDVEFGDDRWLVRDDGLPKLTVEQRFGQAVLRLRLYRGWSQRDVQRSSGVHQSQISRLETGRQHGLSSRRIFAILRALRVGEVAFMPPPSAPQTALEFMLRGDPWERAGRAAERRVNRRRSA